MLPIYYLHSCPGKVTVLSVSCSLFASTICHTGQAHSSIGQITDIYSLIQTKCQGGNKYALPITVKFDQSTRRFGRMSFARLFKLTKHIALLLYLLSTYLLCMRDSRNVRKHMHIIKTIMKFCAHWSTVCGMTNSDASDSNSVSQVCAALQRPIISKCQHSTKFENTVYVKFSLIFANLCWLAK